jgi:Tfp pilus assembly protein PilW
MLIRRAFMRFRSGQSGLTLVELLVTMASGLIVSFAAFTLIDITLHSSGRVADRIDATQRGRVAMEHLVQLLSSGCLASDVSPIQPTYRTDATSTGRRKKPFYTDNTDPLHPIPY